MVGTEPDLGASGLLVGTGTRLVLVREAHRADGKWKVVVGGIRRGENSREAAVRETGEEACFSVDLKETRFHSSQTPRRARLAGAPYRPFLWYAVLSELEFTKRVKDSRLASFAKYRRVPDDPREWFGDENDELTRVRVFRIEEALALNDLLEQHRVYIEEVRCKMQALCA